MYSLQYDTNEKQSARPDFLMDAWVYYRKQIAKPVEGNLLFDILLTGNGKTAGAEVKEIADVFGSLPPRGRLGRQCMDIAVTCDYGYLAILGSMDDLRAAIPTVYMTQDGPVQKSEDQIMKAEDMLLAILGDIKSLGITPLFLSRDPIFAYRTLLKLMVHDIADDAPMTLLCKPYKDMHAINMMSNLPGIGWERAEAILAQFGSVAEFMMVAQGCCESGDFTTLEDIKINSRKLGKSAQKMFETEGIWS